MTRVEALFLAQATAIREVAEARQGLASVLISLQDSGLTAVAFAHPLLERAMYRVRDTAARLELASARLKEAGTGR